MQRKRKSQNNRGSHSILFLLRKELALPSPIGTDVTHDPAILVCWTYTITLISNDAPNQVYIKEETAGMVRLLPYSGFLVAILVLTCS